MLISKGDIFAMMDLKSDKECSFKNKIRNNIPVIGIFMKTLDPAFVETAGRAGLDYVILDMEHGHATYETIQNNIRAAECAGLFPIVRLQDARADYIGKALDIGAGGIQVPQVASAKTAGEIVKAARFYPQGERGVCRFARAAGYSSIDAHDYFKKSNENLVILQMEGSEAIRNIDSILDVKGVDIIFIGPYDLSQSLGVPGEVEHPLVVDAMKKIVEKANERNIVTGTFVDRPESIERWINAGVLYISCSVDVGIFLNGCRSIAEHVERLLDKRK
jgi:4-hydroxy-2-oxoheptanedioate aldolase